MRSLTKRLMFVLVLMIFVFSSNIAFARTTLTYWTFLDPTAPGPRTEVQNYVIEKFEREHPGVKVEVEVIQWDKIVMMLVTSAKAQKGPDVVRIFEPDFKMALAADTVSPIDEYVAHWGADEREDWIIPWDSTVVDGKKYGLFWDTRVRNLWYRADLLEEAGLQVPESLEQLAEAASILNSDRVTGIIVNVSRQYATDFGEWFLPTLYGAGGELVHEDDTAAFNSDAGTKVLEWIDDLVNVYEAMPKGVPAIPYEDAYQAFLAGNLAFLSSGSHRVVDARTVSGLGEKLKTAPWPGFEPGTPSPAWASGWILSVGAYSKNKDLAWELIQAFLDPEVQLMSAKLAGEMPARKSVLNDAWFETEEASEMRSWVEYAADYPFEARMPEKWPLLVDSLATAVDDMLTRGLPAEQVLKEAAQTYNHGL